MRQIVGCLAPRGVPTCWRLRFDVRACAAPSGALAAARRVGLSAIDRRGVLAGAAPTKLHQATGRY